MTARQCGFTLLEAIVALAVFGFLMVGLTESLHFGVRGWASQDRDSGRAGDLDAADRALRGLIEQMDPGPPLTALRLVARPQVLGFDTELPLGAAALRSRRIEAELRVDPDHTLVLRWRPAPPAPPAPVQRTVLLQGVETVAFSYLRPPESGGGWVSSWQLPVPPVLVRVHIAFAKDDPRDWPDIVAAPMLTRLP